MPPVTQAFGNHHMKKILPILKWFFLIWGGFSFVAMLFLGALFAYWYGPGNKDKIDYADKDDVRFVLNWCGIGDSNFKKVINSFSSAKSFTGDHLEAFSIKVKHISIDELTDGPKNDDTIWHRGDKLDGIIDDAMSFLAGSLTNDIANWFPSEKELRTDRYYCSISTLYYSKETPIGGSLIIIRPSDNMVFYIGEKT